LTSHTHDRKFDILNAYDWLLILATSAAILAVILAVVLHVKVRTFFLLLASSGRSHALPSPHANGISNGIHYITTSPMPQSTLDYFYYHKMVQKLFPVDLTLLLLYILFVIGFFGYLYYKYRASRKARTKLVLELGNGDKSFTWNGPSLLH